MVRRALLAAASACALFAATGCAPENRNAADVEAEALNQREWDAFVSRFIDGYFVQNPGFAVYQGRHEFDGKLPDWSAEGLAAQADFLKRSIADARKFDAKALTEPQRFERDYLIAVAEGQLFWLSDADQPHHNPAFYLGAGLDPNVYIARPYADAETRMRAFIAFARNVPAAAAQIRANLRTPMPLSFIDYGKAGFEGLAGYYVGDAKAAFASVKNAELQREFDTAAGAASKAMQELAVWLESGRKDATQDFALGKDRFQRMLYATERVDTPVAELERIGWADLRRNQAALKSACDTFAPGASIADCMVKLNADKPEGGPVAGARRQLPMLKQFLIDKDIVSIPGAEEALVEESPPYNRQNSAYIDIPGPYEKGLPSVFYISPPDPAWSPAVQQAYIPGEKDLLFTSVHEVWPGHFLNFLHANRAKSLFGKVFVGYAYAEGWAHYTEEMMWDAGLGEGDAETHVGQLSNALLRNCRFVSAIGLHSGTLSQEGARKLFIEQCYQDEGNARQQAARGTYDPAYLNYTLGKLMIRKLRDDWTTQNGGRKAWKEFHNRFLGYGGPPIPLVRQMMLGGDGRAVF
ncbi:DUF885 domain-containing protein [Sphingomonas sp. C3-2]|uniref:DUF885 domain-containing protein n=1 Tax=Sphingomonas sp. C3-2 TaxID=3062169 RepID=UPI00294B73E5|nr:DUF885 domain-containing protein [Sphingomonas sp. C3-2]WOK37137.1 DUF885 domain-containing protein [Sphingomonas sp. C3-2]